MVLPGGIGIYLGKFIYPDEKGIVGLHTSAGGQFENCIDLSNNSGCRIFQLEMDQPKAVALGYPYRIHRNFFSPLPSLHLQSMKLTAQSLLF